MKDFKIPFAVISFLAVQLGGAIWWASQLDGRLKNLRNTKRISQKRIVDILSRWFNHLMELVKIGKINTTMSGY